MSAPDMTTNPHPARRLLPVAAAALALSVALAVVLLARAGDGGSTAADYARQVATGAPADQAQLLKDGVVTKDEYEAALNATIACLRAEGVNAEATPGTGLKPIRLGFSAASLAEAERAQTVLARCRAEHSEEVETVWGKQNTERLKANGSPALALLRECMRANVGDNAPSLGTMAELTQFLDVSVSAEGSRDPDTSRVVRAYFKTCKPLVEERIGVALP